MAIPKRKNTIFICFLCPLEITRMIRLKVIIMEIIWPILVINSCVFISTSVYTHFTVTRNSPMMSYMLSINTLIELLVTLVIATIPIGIVAGVWFGSEASAEDNPKKKKKLIWKMVWSFAAPFLTLIGILVILTVLYLLI